MTAIATKETTWERFRTELSTEVLASLPEHVQRLAWSCEKIQAAQQEGLRRLLSHAVEHSSFHRRRLAGIEVNGIDLDELSRVPIMTKADMMPALDDVFTDRRLSRALVEQALAATDSEPVPILGTYVALATGGGSGGRGVFVFDVAAKSGFLLSLLRGMMGRLQALGGPPPGGLPVVMVAAASAVHATGAAAAETKGGELPLRIQKVPVILPLPEIAERLNALQAPALFGYPSVLARLASERRAGRLRIAPIAITSTSETLLPEVRASITDAFGAPVVDAYATTEGLVGTSAPGDSMLIFKDDLCIIELVDADNRPVPPGVASTKVLLTNLYNLVQPLIRYELTDVFVRQPDAPDHGHLQAHVQGRADEVLRYEDVDVHPHVVRSVLLRTPDITDYQVRQTARGIDVNVIAAADAPLEDLSRCLTEELAHTGLAQPDVRVQAVENLPRHPQTGKLRRYVPLPAS